MKIVIETIPHAEQRYETVGDWSFDHEGNLSIRVSEMPDWRHSALVGLHEAVEALLCRERAIAGREVDDFDMRFSGGGEPGDDPACPYRAEHFAATTIERLLARELFVDWQEYSSAIERLSRS